MSSPPAPADPYADAARGWAGGAELVYGPLARALVDRSPHDLTGRTVLDAGAGTGAAAAALLAAGARPLSLDLSHDMLRWHRERRPPAVRAAVHDMPLRSRSVDDVVAAFVLNHLDEPAAAVSEMARVTRPGGAVLASAFSVGTSNLARDRIDVAARAAGWIPPAWYVRFKEVTAPLVGSREAMAAVAREGGLHDVTVHECPVAVGVDDAEDLVTYRFGQSPLSGFVESLGPAAADALRAEATAAAAAVMEPYRPVVVYLLARIP